MRSQTYADNHALIDRASTPFSARSVYSAVGNFVGQQSNSTTHSVNFGGDTFISGTGNDVFNGLTNANGDFNNGDTVDYSHAPTGVGNVWCDSEPRDIRSTGYGRPATTR